MVEFALVQIGLFRGIEVNDPDYVDVSECSVHRVFYTMSMYKRSNRIID